MNQIFMKYNKTITLNFEKISIIADLFPAFEQ